MTRPMGPDRGPQRPRGGDLGVGHGPTSGGERAPAHGVGAPTGEHVRSASPLYRPIDRPPRRSAVTAKRGFCHNGPRGNPIGVFAMT
jgi:hypothetical protein